MNPESSFRRGTQHAIDLKHRIILLQMIVL